MNIYHLNCGLLHAPPNPKASCHCLLLETEKGLVLVDTGIGMKDVQNPEGRINPEVIANAGFQFHEALTAVRQLEKMGFAPDSVRHIVLSHLDNDHTGGISDFPNAVVHVAKEEYEAFRQGSYRYSPRHLEHNPELQLYTDSTETWYGFEARSLVIPGLEDHYLIPLFGHTKGHCGVAVPDGDKWLFYVGDAYYLRAELETSPHPVDALAAMSAEDDTTRRHSLQKIRMLMQAHAQEIEIFGYHDFGEFKEPVPLP